ncbi:MAG: DNA cytosine methyltransferase [Kiritimatiellia bacterium]
MPTEKCDLTYATVCSGIECMSAAVAPLGGWRPVFFSEIEPFPCALLKHRYPTVPNLGDMTKIKAEKIGEEKWRITNGTDAVELAGRLGCLAGGTPCQDVSVAGKRAGMAEGSGTRSSLAFHFARLCRELQPRWVLWENVPGVLTSNGGRDFAHFVRSIGECGYSVAYRVLDAQYVRVVGLPRGVPQRRRRCWLVGHLGDDWRTPAEVLFEPEGVRGDSPPRRITGKGFAGEAGGGAEGADRPLPTNSNGGDVMPALTSRDLEARLTGQAEKSGGYVISPSGFDPYEPGGVKSETEEVAGALVNGSSPGFHSAVCFENHQTDARTTEADVAPTMGASRNAQASNNNPLVVAPLGGAEVFGKTSHAVDKAGTGEKYERIEVAETRNTFANSEVRSQEVVVQPGTVGEVVAIDMDKNKPTNADKPVRKGGAGFGVSEKGTSYTLTARDQHAVAYAIDSMGSNAMKSKNPKSGCREVECAPTLTTVDPAPVKHQGGTAVVECLPAGSENPQAGVAAEVVGVFDMGARKTGAGTDTSGVSPTVLAQHGTDPHAVCIGFNGGSEIRDDCGGAVSFEPGLAKREGEGHRFSDEVASTLRADMGDNRPAVATVDYIVRRLTPLECERLQGLPDGYTLIPHRGKPAAECPDTPRYKALGNGWAVNCARWICQRIQKHDMEKQNGTE